MSERPERLSDEDLAWLITNTNSSYARRAAIELRDLRRLVYGGTCPTCQGTDHILNASDPSRAELPCPDCVSGRTPGLIERLARDDGRYYSDSAGCGVCFWCDEEEHEAGCVWVEARAFIAAGRDTEPQ